MNDWLDLFREDGPTSHMCWTECKVCGMGSLGGIDWFRKHTCPEPYPAEVAQSIWDSLVFPGAPPMHPVTKARLQMSWRHGFAKSFEEREAAQ